MTDDEREKALYDIFAMPGWRVLMADLEEAQEVLRNTTHNLNTLEELHHRKGMLQQIGNFLAFETTFRQLGEEDDAEAVGF